VAIGKQYEKENQSTRVGIPTRTEDISTKQQAREFTAEPNEAGDTPTFQSPTVPKETAEAAEHYRRTSATIKREEIRAEYRIICDCVTANNYRLEAGRLIYD